MGFFLGFVMGGVTVYFWPAIKTKLVAWYDTLVAWYDALVAKIR